MGEAGPGPGSTALQRQSGRSNNQIRSLLCARGILTRADGSAKWTQDTSSCIVGVYGPQRTQSYREDAEQATILVQYKPRLGLAGPREKLYEQILRQTIEGAVIAKLHPRTAISVTVQELSSDGAELACALNGVSAALTDAGIPLKYTFAAVACCLTRDGALLVDPDGQEEQDAQAVVMNCYSMKASQPDQATSDISSSLLASYTVGSLPVQQFLKLKELSHLCCERIGLFSRKSVVQAFS